MEEFPSTAKISVSHVTYLLPTYCQIASQILQQIQKATKAREGRTSYNDNKDYNTDKNYLKEDIHSKE